MTAYTTTHRNIAIAIIFSSGLTAGISAVLVRPPTKQEDAMNLYSHVMEEGAHVFSVVADVANYLDRSGVAADQLGREVTGDPRMFYRIWDNEPQEDRTLALLYARMAKFYEATGMDNPEYYEETAKRHAWDSIRSTLDRAEVTSIPQAAAA